MKSQKNILIAFLLNLSFAVIELIGGTWTGSVAILSDAVHDLGDAVAIGLAYYLERLSGKQPDQDFTYGYLRYSVLASVLTTLILLMGSTFVVLQAVKRLFYPVPIDYTGMIWIALLGLVMNLAAAYVTREGDSLNQRAVNLHMLEDLLGWIVVLIGAVIMKFTNLAWIDAFLSIGVALFIAWNAAGTLHSAVSLMLEKSPKGLDSQDLIHHLSEIEGVQEVHHLHLWSLDGQANFATLHVVTDQAGPELKQRIRQELLEHGVGHVTIELEGPGEVCQESICQAHHLQAPHSHHHHHAH